MIGGKRQAGGKVSRNIHLPSRYWDMLGASDPDKSKERQSLLRRFMPNHVGRQAVVIGAGMGGLSATRALADCFEQVLIIENDALPADAAPRPGTPQCKHVHGLLMGGQQALESLFPGLEQAMNQAGAVPVRMTSDVRFERPGYDPFPQRDLGLQILCMTRPRIEATVRKKIALHGNISVRECCKAQELLVTSNASGKTSEVTGVRCAYGNGKTEDIGADCVVDASSHGLLTESAGFAGTSCARGKHNGRGHRILH